MDIKREERYKGRVNTNSHRYIYKVKYKEISTTDPKQTEKEHHTKRRIIARNQVNHRGNDDWRLSNIKKCIKSGKRIEKSLTNVGKIKGGLDS